MTQKNPSAGMSALVCPQQISHFLSLQLGHITESHNKSALFIWALWQDDDWTDFIMIYKNTSADCSCLKAHKNVFYVLWAEAPRFYVPHWNVSNNSHL